MRRRDLVQAAALRVAVLALVALVAMLAARRASAESWIQNGERGPRTQVTAPVPKAIEEVQIEERLGAQLPLDATFADSTGKPVRLGDFFAPSKPVVLSLVYYDCPMLCGLITSGMAQAMKKNGLELGKDFRAVTVSFDPREKPRLAAERQRGYLQSIGHPDGKGDWVFLTGQEAPIHALADAIGFHYAWDPKTKQWGHMAAIYVVTASGRISRYLYGIEFPPRDLRLALVEAGEGRVGTSFDRILLTCYRYDPASRTYEPYALGFVRAGGAAVLLALGGLLAVLWRRELKGRRK